MKLAQIDIDSAFFGWPKPMHLILPSGISRIISFVLNAAFVAAGLILLVFIVVAGINLIAGAGSNNPEKLEKGKQAIGSAAAGFAVVFVAYWIVKLIGLITGLDFMGLF